jgi:hypothetical protein
MKLTSYHTDVCMQTWLQCETLLFQLREQDLSYSDRTRQVLNECASICLGTLDAAERKADIITQLAVLCVGICEECAEICERYSDSIFQLCAATCRSCANAFTQVAARAV